MDPLPIHYPLRIRIHYESVYPSIIHHVSLSIILSRLRIHLETTNNKRLRMDRASLRMDRANLLMDRAKLRMDRAKLRMDRAKLRMDRANCEQLKQQQQLSPGTIGNGPKAPLGMLETGPEA